MENSKLTTTEIETYLTGNVLMTEQEAFTYFLLIHFKKMDVKNPTYYNWIWKRIKDVKTSYIVSNRTSKHNFLYVKENENTKKFYALGELVAYVIENEEGNKL